MNKCMTDMDLNECMYILCQTEKIPAVHLHVFLRRSVHLACVKPKAKIIKIIKTNNSTVGHLFIRTDCTTCLWQLSSQIMTNILSLQKNLIILYSSVP